MKYRLSYFILFFLSFQGNAAKYTNGQFYISLLDDNAIEFYLPSYGGLSVYYAGYGKYELIKNEFIIVDLKYGYNVNTLSKYSIIGEKEPNDMSTDVYVYDKSVDEYIVGAAIRYKSSCDRKFYSEVIDTPGGVTINYKGIPLMNFVTVEAGGYQSCRMPFTSIINKIVRIEMASGWMTFLDDTKDKYNIRIRKDNDAIWVLTGKDKYEKFILEK